MRKQHQSLLLYVITGAALFAVVIGLLGLLYIAGKAAIDNCYVAGALFAIMAIILCYGAGKSWYEE